MRQLRRGRLIDHVHLRAKDLEATKRFYRAVLHAIGKGETIFEDDKHLQADELWIDKADGTVSHVHLAFQTSGEDQVKAFHKAALEAGGIDNGPPGERKYHPGYYAAFVLDPDGNNIEAVYHGPMKASADVIVITPEAP